MGIEAEAQRKICAKKMQKVIYNRNLVYKLVIRKQQDCLWSGLTVSQCVMKSLSSLLLDDSEFSAAPITLAEFGSPAGYFSALEVCWGVIFKVNLALVRGKGATWAVAVGLLLHVCLDRSVELEGGGEGGEQGDEGDFGEHFSF